jgi:hypothetical protein
MFPFAGVFAQAGGSVADSSQWDVTSFQVKLVDHRGGSGDIQTDQNGWIYLGANHLEGGDIKYSVDVGELYQEDIIEVWIDGYSTSTELDVGPTVFVGTGKNRYEQITRMTGDAWRPFVFRFADDALYGDVTDPSNRNANWRTRYPSSKYEIRRIDKAPYTMLDGTSLPIRISMTGVDDFIIKRLEVVVYRAKEGSSPRGGSVHIVKVSPYTVHEGNRVTVTLNTGKFADYIEFYLSDPAGREYKVATQSISADNTEVAFYADEYYFPRSGQYQLKLVDLSRPEQRYADIERLEYRGRKVIIPQADPTPPILTPEIECATAMVGGSCLPPVPVMPGTGYGVPGPYISPVPAPYDQLPYGPVPGPSPMVAPPQSQIQAAGYTIQVGAFKSQSSAAALRDKLQQRGFDAFIAESSQGGNPLFRVRVGRFLDKSSASQEVQRLRSNGFSDTWITDL